MVYYSYIIYINNILKYFYFYIKCVSLFSFASFLFFFAYTVCIRYVYGMDTLCIQYGYSMHRVCIGYVYPICFLPKSSFYAAFSCFGSLVFSRLVNHLATKRQPKKSPSFSARAKCLSF